MMQLRPFPVLATTCALVLPPLFAQDTKPHVEKSVRQPTPELKARLTQISDTFFSQSDARQRFHSTAKQLSSLSNDVSLGLYSNLEDLKAIAHCITHTVYIRWNLAAETFDLGGDLVTEEVLNLNCQVVLAARSLKAKNSKTDCRLQDFECLKDELLRNRIFCDHKRINEKCREVYRRLYIDTSTFSGAVQSLNLVQLKNPIAEGAVHDCLRDFVQAANEEVRLARKATWSFERASKLSNVVELLEKLRFFLSFNAADFKDQKLQKSLADAEADMRTLVEKELLKDAAVFLSRPSRDTEREYIASVLALGIKLTDPDQTQIKMFSEKLGINFLDACANCSKFSGGYASGTPETVQFIGDLAQIVFLQDKVNAKRLLGDMQPNDQKAFYRLTGDATSVLLRLAAKLNESTQKDYRSIITWYVTQGAETGFLLPKVSPDAAMLGEWLALIVNTVGKDEFIDLSGALKLVEQTSKPVTKSIKFKGAPNATQTEVITSFKKHLDPKHHVLARAVLLDCDASKYIVDQLLPVPVLPLPRLATEEKK